MTPFEQYPNLFCNRKFAIKINSSGTEYRLDGGWLEEFQQEKPEYMEKFTLIARPISDMTEGEVCEYDSMLDYDWEHDGWDTPESFLYLLSIGVYPFNQDDFETGKVINGANHD